MVRSISTVRFRWKLPIWMDPTNIEGFWLYCYKGMLSFEIEVKDNISLPDEPDRYARFSKNRDNPNFIRLTDVKTMANLGRLISNFHPHGILGEKVLIGKYPMHEGDNFAEVPVFSTLEDWYWLTEMKPELK